MRFHVLLSLLLLREIHARSTSPITVNTNAILASYPYKLPSLNVPNAMNAANTGLANVFGTLKKVPPKIVGTPKDMSKTAEQVGRQALVAGNYMVLNGALGVKPTENSGMAEYRRTTQTPIIDFQLTKLKSEEPETQDDLAKEISTKNKREIETLLNTEKELLQKNEELLSRNSFLNQALASGLTEEEGGPIGASATTAATLGATITEKALLQAPALIRKTQFAPIAARARNAYLLKKPIAWLPQSARTFKTSLSSGKRSTRSFKKHTPSELRDESNPLGVVERILNEQKRLRKAERLDT